MRLSTMKSQNHNHNHHHHPKLKTQPRPFFSCSFFRHCTQSSLSPTATAPPPLSVVPPQPLFSKPESSSSSSSSTNSHSFTQWRFPSPIHPSPSPPPPPPPPHSYQLQQLFHATELHLSTGSDSDKLSALHLLERSLVPNPPSDPLCPPQLMHFLVANLKTKAAVAKSATKILLALCLAEGNRHVAVEAGAVGAVVEVAMELEAAAAERGLAALELMCTVSEGAAELRAHALAVPVMVCMMGKLGGRGKEYAISALAVVYSGEGSEDQAPPEEVARAVVLALQEDCTERGHRKGNQLLKALEDYGRLDLISKEMKGHQ